MKKKIILIICAAIMAAGLIGCEQKEVETVESVTEDETMEYSETIHTRPTLVEVEATYYYRVYYHRDTKVMYVNGVKSNAFTVLVNPDGTPMIWEE